MEEMVSFMSEKIVEVYYKEGEENFEVNRCGQES